MFKRKKKESYFEQEEVEKNKKETAELLQKKANPKCTKCFGTGRRGWNITYHYWIACQCVGKNLPLAKNN